MEPRAEPRRIRIDDRSNVRLALANLAPLDICTRSASPPTATPETNVAASLVTAIAGMLGATAAPAPASESIDAFAQFSLSMYLNERSDQQRFLTRVPVVACDAKEDPEYKKLVDGSDDFFRQATALVGPPPSPDGCVRETASQVGLACELDFQTRRLAAFAAADYRGFNQSNFRVDGNPALQPVRNAFGSTLPSIDQAGKLQALVDEMAAWAADLHKKYDFRVPAGDSSAPQLPPVVPGALTVAPLSVGLASANAGAIPPPQRVRISSGGQSGAFTATPSSTGGWLHVSTLSDTAPASGFFELLVTADPTGIDPKDSRTLQGSITISGTGAVKGSSVIRVTFKPAPLPSQCDLDTLREADRIVDRAKAEMSLLSDNNKTLTGAQAALKAAFVGMVKIEDDFKRRVTQGTVIVDPSGVLVQPFNLATDRKGTSTGYLACVNAVDGKTPTTTNINYTLLYQDIPRWTASAGLLTSFIEKKIIGLEAQSNPPGGAASGSSVLVQTDHAFVQFVPMAFVNYRIGRYHPSRYGKRKEDQLATTVNASLGFGINPNSGTNQVELFGGLAFGLNRFLIHVGADLGRQEGPGGGYSLNSPVPSTVTAAPISWHWHGMISIGFSVRLAPY
jgi:hypothetical protein